MPIVDSNKVLASLPEVRTAAIVERQLENVTQEGEPPGVVETMGEAFMEQNLLYALPKFFGQNINRDESVVPGYDAYVDDADITLSDPEHVGEYSNSLSPTRTRQIFRELQRDKERRENLARSGPFGVFAQIAMGIASPESLIPVASFTRAARGVGALRGLSRARQIASLSQRGAATGFVETAAAGALAEGLAELALGATQRTRTPEEQLNNILAASILSGLLGGVGGALGESRRGLRELTEAEIAVGLTGSRTMQKIDAEDLSGLSHEGKIGRITQILAEDNPNAAILMREPTSFLGGFWRKVMRFNPQFRLMTSRSVTFRKVIKALSDNPTIRIDDLKLGDDVGTSVEAAITIHYGKVGRAILDIRDIYKGSRLGMRESQFRGEVTRAMRNGDEPAESIVDLGARDAVSRAAKAARAIFDSIAEDAEAVGLLAKRELKGTAKTYVTRVWDREKVNANQPELKRILVRHFSNDHNLRVNPEKLADDAIDSIKGSRVGVDFIPTDRVGAAGAFRERLLLVRDHDIEEFLEDDIIEILNRFVNDTAPQVELAKAFRGGTGVLDNLSARLDQAVKNAERTGDTREVIDLLEDTASLRAGAAFGSQFTEESIAKQRQVQKLVKALPGLRTQAREIEKRHASFVEKDTQYRSAKETLKEVEAEVGGSQFDNLPQTVRNAFEGEVVASRLASSQRAVGRAKEFLDQSTAQVADLRRAEKRTRQRIVVARAKGDAPRLAKAERDAQDVKTQLKNARAVRNRRKKIHSDKQAFLAKKRKGLAQDPSTRKRFFQAWRRWIQDVPEESLPATRRALSRFAKHPNATDLKKLGTDYVAAVGRVEAMRGNIGRVRANRDRLKLELDEATGAQGEAQATLKGLREDAKEIDAGVLVTVDPQATRLEDLANTAETAIANARRADALRAISLQPVAARARADANKRIEEPGANANRINNEFDNEVRDLEAVRDNLLNRSRIERMDPHHWAFRAERALRRINFMRFMGGVTISSLPDVAMSVFTNGLGPTIRAWRSVLKQPLREISDQLTLSPTNSLARLADQEELVRMNVAIELASNARVKSYGDISDLLGPATRVEKGIDRLSNRFANLILINRWNAMHKGVATLSTMNRMLDDIETLVTKGDLSVGGRKNLAASGVSETMARKIWAQWKEFGQVEGSFGKLRGQRLPRTQDWLDTEAREAFQQAVISDVRRTIITPSSADLPRFMTLPFVRLLGQFRSFAFSSTSKILFSGLQRRDAAAMQGFIFQVMMGAVVFATHEMIRGRDPFEKSEAEWVQNAIDRSGALGILMDVNGALERSTYGKIGVSRFTSGTPATRFNSRNVISAWLGPTVGTTFDLAEVGGAPFAPGGVTQQNVRTFRKLVPWNQIFYLRFLVDQLEGTVSGQFPKDRTEAKKRAGIQ